MTKFEKAIFTMGLTGAMLLATTPCLAQPGLTKPGTVIPEEAPASLSKDSMADTADSTSEWQGIESEVTQGNAEIAPAENASTEEQEEQRLEVDWVLILAIVASVLALGLAALCLLMKKAKEEAEALRCEETSELESRLADAAQLNDSLHQQLTQALEEAAQWRGKYQSRSKEMSSSGRGDGVASIIHSRAPQRRFPQVYYATLPVDGIFQSVGEDFRAAKTLYRITETAEGEGRFEFAADALNTKVARQSLTQFVEVACTIVNDNGYTAVNEIVNVAPGTVKRTGNGWAIDRKAEVKVI